MTVVVDRVSVSAGDQPLLAPVSLNAQAGDVVSVRGANGSGKTTLLRVLSGLTPPTSGRALVSGEAVDAKNPAFRRRVAALIGLPPLARNLTLAEHLDLVGLSWGDTDVATRTETLLRSLGVGALASRFPHELSSGQTQLFALALTVSRPSEVLLLDEPEQRLDPERLVLVRDTILRLAGEGRIVIMATHSRWLAEATHSRGVSLVDTEHAAG